tara:strand:- start:3653 stop:3916 length:264 start_codon:yes stop_codon:yes gene_type:complete
LCHHKITDKLSEFLLGQVSHAQKERPAVGLYAAILWAKDPTRISTAIPLAELRRKTGDVRFETGDERLEKQEKIRNTKLEIRSNLNS